jgi:hypothetical protein
VKAMDVMVRNVLTVKPDTSVVEVAPDCSLRTTSAHGLSLAMRGRWSGSSPLHQWVERSSHLVSYFNLLFRCTIVSPSAFPVSLLCDWTSWLFLAVKLSWRILRAPAVRVVAVLTTVANALNPPLWRALLPPTVRGDLAVEWHVKPVDFM